MSEFIVATRYASSFLASAIEKNIIQSVSAEMEDVFKTIKNSKEFQRILVNPIISQEKKKSIISEVFQTNFSKEVVEFLIFIVQKRRENLLFEIVKRFLQLRDDYLGFINAEVESAVEFDQPQKDRIKNKLAEITKKNIRLNFRVNSNVIGGFIVRIGDTIMDASIKHQLESLRQKFLSESYSYN